GDLLQHGVDVLVPGLQAFEVEHAEAAEAPDLHCGRRRDHRVHGGREQGDVEAVGVDLPAQVDVVGIPGPPGRDDGDVVEAVGPPGRLCNTDLQVQVLPLPDGPRYLSVIPALCGLSRRPGHVGAHQEPDDDKG